MDINKIIKIVQSIPKNKWNDDKTIKKTIEAALKEAGVKMSDEDLKKNTDQFMKIAKGGNPLALVSMLMKNGISVKHIEDIKKKMDGK